MPNYGTLFGSAMNAGAMAESQARIIARHPTPITVDTRLGNRDLPGAQTVRIEALRDPREVVGEAAAQSQAWVVVIGYKGHATIADTDLQHGDEFAVGAIRYRVHAVAADLPGKFEAYGMAVG
jgi:hypothetical protein